MKIGILTNPSAGRGHAVQSVISRIESCWPDHELYTIDSPAGSSFKRAVHLPAPEGGYVEKLYASVEQLVSAGAEMLVTLGGDGTAAYAAEALHLLGCRIPILGIGLGTANVGPIVTLSSKDPIPPVESLCFKAVSGIAVYSGGRRIAAGYNDVIFGNTYLATIKGEMIAADGQALLEEGRVRPGKPLSNVLTPQTRILKNGTFLPVSLPEVGQIIAAPIDRDALYGRTVLGVYCFSAGSPDQGALTLCARSLISYEPDHRGYGAFAPEEHLLFSADDTITTTGLAPSVLAVCDGNPLKITDGSVTLQYIPQDVLIAKRR